MHYVQKVGRFEHFRHFETARSQARHSPFVAFVASPYWPDGQVETQLVPERNSGGTQRTQSVAVVPLQSAQLASQERQVMFEFYVKKPTRQLAIHVLLLK